MGFPRGWEPEEVKNKFHNIAQFFAIEKAHRREPLRKGVGNREYKVQEVGNSDPVTPTLPPLLLLQEPCTISLALRWIKVDHDQSKIMIKYKTIYCKDWSDNVYRGVITIFRLANISLLQVY